MKYQNNATLIKRALLIQIAKAFYNNNLIETIDRIPIDMFPKSNRELLRCCVYKERVIVKHRIMSILGFGADEDNELTPLSRYAELALAREFTARLQQNEILSVLDIACAGCVKSQYLITNACRGCMARPCTLNCPKKAIKMVKGQAQINSELCINCGICLQACPYHAIIRVPIPCEEVCPVDAISKDSEGKTIIDFNKCILCGQCMISCPFGAMIEKSQFIDVMKVLHTENSGAKEVVAMLAPAIAGNQFKGSLQQIGAAVKKLGFSHVYEVAGGADVTSKHEAEEFKERITNGDAMMTTSCCPAYTEAVKKHIPELQKYVSTTKTPLYYTAEIVKKALPQAVTVFIGPCIAKRKESQNNGNVDYVLTFEELEALFAAKNIEVAKCEGIELENRPSYKARGFATTCGVTDAVLEKSCEKITVCTHFIDGLNKKSIKQLKSYARQQSYDFNFLEVMGCEGGCVGGPCVIGKLQQAQQTIRKIANPK